MTIMDIIIKILLFFFVFYGAIVLTSMVSKKIRKSQSKDETTFDKKHLKETDSKN